MIHGRYCVLVCGHMNAEIEKRCLLRSQHVLPSSFRVPQQNMTLLPTILPFFHCSIVSHDFPNEWQVCCRYGDFGQMFDVMLRQAPEEQWDMVYPVDDEWPSADRMASYQVGAQRLLLSRDWRYSF